MTNSSTCPAQDTPQPEIQPTNVVFKTKWDEWIHSAQRPSHKPRAEEDKIKEGISTAIQGISNDALIHHIKTRYVIDSSLEQALKQAHATFQIESSSNSQGGAVTLHIVINAVLDEEQHYGFIINLRFDDDWRLKPETVKEANFEDTLAYQVEGKHKAFIKKYSSQGMDIEDMQEALKNMPEVPLSPETRSLLAGEKLRPVSFSIMRMQLDSLHEKTAAKSANVEAGSKAIADFLHQRATTGGITPPVRHEPPIIFSTSPAGNVVPTFFMTQRRQNPSPTPKVKKIEREDVARGKQTSASLFSIFAPLESLPRDLDLTMLWDTPHF